MATLFVITGYMREEIFYQINAQISFLNGDYPYNYTEPFYLQFLDGKTIDSLIQLKWFWTIVAAIVNFGLAVLALFLFKRMNLFRYLLAIFGGLVILSAVFYGIGYITGIESIGYRMARIFMGFLQSPLPLMLLIPAQYLSKK